MESHSMTSPQLVSLELPRRPDRFSSDLQDLLAEFAQARAQGMLDDGDEPDEFSDFEVPAAAPSISTASQSKKKSKKPSIIRKR